MNYLGSTSSDRSRRCLTQTQIPPGSIRAATSNVTRHPLPSLAAVMSAPERRNMPQIHPQRLNGGLWFGIDDCIRKDIVATYQSNFWGPWWNYGMVPQDKKDQWWTTFVQKYYWAPEHHNMVHARWKTVLQDSIGDTVSKRKRAGKKPEFIGLADWGSMLETWEEEAHQKRSKINSENASSNPDGHGSHRHTSGSKSHLRIAYDMEVEAGGVAPPATAVVLKTHSNKAGVCIDKRAEALVKAAEALAMERSQSSSLTEGTITTPSNHQLTAAYIETATTKKGRVYGLGSIQTMDVDPNEAEASLLLKKVQMEERLAKMEERLAKMEESIPELKQGMSTMNESVAALNKGMEILLRLNGIDLATYNTQPRESAASAPSPFSETSQQQQANQTDHNSPINLAASTPR